MSHYFVERAISVAIYALVAICLFAIIWLKKMLNISRTLFFINAGVKHFGIFCTARTDNGFISIMDYSR